MGHGFQSNVSLEGMEYPGITWMNPHFQLEISRMIRKQRKSWLVGGLEYEFYDFSYMECHHPN